MTAVAQRYAKALYALAQETKNVDAIEQDLKALHGLLSESQDFQKLVSTPIYARDDQLAVVREIASKAGFSAEVKNTLGVLAQNRRLSVIPQLISIFQSKLNADRGIVVARVETAQSVSSDQEGKLKQILKNVTGKDDISLDIIVNKDLLGGMVVKLGSRMIDTSVRTRLHNLESALKKTN